jgi:hypothetical protein
VPTLAFVFARGNAAVVAIGVKLSSVVISVVISAEIARCGRAGARRAGGVGLWWSVAGSGGLGQRS